MALFIIDVPAKGLADLGMKISLLPEIMEELEGRLGQLSEPGFWMSWQLAEAEGSRDPWGWIYELGDSSQKNRVRFWFRDAAQATYYKLRWGGR